MLGLGYQCLNCRIEMLVCGPAYQQVLELLLCTGIGVLTDTNKVVIQPELADIPDEEIDEVLQDYFDKVLCN